MDTDTMVLPAPAGTYDVACVESECFNGGYANLIGNYRSEAMARNAARLHRRTHTEAETACSDSHICRRCGERIPARRSAP